MKNHGADRLDFPVPTLSHLTDSRVTATQTGKWLTSELKPGQWRLSHLTSLTVTAEVVTTQLRGWINWWPFVWSWEQVALSIIIIHNLTNRFVRLPWESIFQASLPVVAYMKYTNFLEFPQAGNLRSAANLSVVQTSLCILTRIQLVNYTHLSDLLLIYMSRDSLSQ